MHCGEVEHCIMIIKEHTQQNKNNIQTLLDIQTGRKHQQQIQLHAKIDNWRFLGINFIFMDLHNFLAIYISCFVF